MRTTSGRFNVKDVLKSIAYTRNLCAHYGRLYNVKIPKSPRLYQQYSTQGIGNNRIFGVLLCIGHLVLHDERWKELVDGLLELIQRYPSVRIETMGFPKNWRVLLSGEKVSEETVEKIPAPVS